MAVITTHILNSVDGTHATGVEISLKKNGEVTLIAADKTDEGGRFSLEINPKIIDADAQYEMILNTGKYWQSNNASDLNTIHEIVLRFEMPDVNGNYHMPIIFSPHGYSTWKSG